MTTNISMLRRPAEHKAGGPFETLLSCMGRESVSLSTLGVPPSSQLLPGNAADAHPYVHGL